MDCVTLANNHVLDYGVDALADTLAHLATAGIAVVGAGADLQQARELALETHPNRSTQRVSKPPRAAFSGNLWQTTLRAEVEDALCLVEPRGVEPLTSCMPCHPRRFTRSSAALLGTTSSLLRGLVRQSAVVGREVANGITLTTC